MSNCPFDITWFVYFSAPIYSCFKNFTKFAPPVTSQKKNKLRIELKIVGIMQNKQKIQSSETSDVNMQKNIKAI